MATYDELLTALRAMVEDFGDCQCYATQPDEPCATRYAREQLAKVDEEQKRIAQSYTDADSATLSTNAPNCRDALTALVELLDVGCEPSEWMDEDKAVYDNAKAALAAK